MNFVFNQSGEGNTQIGSIGKTRGPEWVRTVDRLPAEADAGYNEEVVALYRDGDTETVGCDYWKYVAKHPEYFPYWMPMPKLPTMADMEAKTDQTDNHNRRKLAQSG